jgi:tetratricopeptide (TPR) repeat protein
MKDMTLAQPGNLPENPTLSVCMIVRDEERMLSRCLKSVQGVSDELIVVDTGSKDDTISIAKDFGAKVFHFRWCDDFAAARNESLKYATCDWVLIIDADEELAADSVSSLKNAICNPWCLLYVVKHDNGVESLSERFNWIDRLFRNHPNIEYTRPYHEMIRPSVEDLIDKDSRWQIGYEPKIVVLHDGYTRFHLPEKQSRGLRIMENYIRKNPNDAYILTKLGGLYCDLKRYRNAEKFLKKAIVLNPNSTETNYNLGLVLQEMGALDIAIQYYQKTIALDSHFIDAYSSLGTAYGQKGMIDKAIKEFRRALTIDPDCIAAHNNLGVAYGFKGMTDDAIVTFRRALTIDPTLSETHKNLAIAYYTKKEYDLAIKHCDKAIELGFEVPNELLQSLAAYRKT